MKENLENVNLLEQFNSKREQWAWTKLVRNNFRRNSMQLRVASEIIDVCERILGETNTRHIYIGFALGIREKVSMAKKALVEGWNPSGNAEFESFIESYINAPPDLRELMENISSLDYLKMYNNLIMDLPPVVRRAIIFNHLYRQQNQLLVDERSGKFKHPPQYIV